MQEQEHMSVLRKWWPYVLSGSILALGIFLLLTWTHLLVVGARHGSVSCIDSLLSKGADGRKVIADRVIPGDEHHVIEMIDMLPKASDKDAAFEMLVYLLDNGKLSHWSDAYPYVVRAVVEIGALGRYYEGTSINDLSSSRFGTGVPQIGIPLLGHLIPLLSSLKGDARYLVWVDVESIIISAQSLGEPLAPLDRSVLSRERWQTDPDGVAKDLTAWWKETKPSIKLKPYDPWRVLLETSGEKKNAAQGDTP